MNRALRFTGLVAAWGLLGFIGAGVWGFANAANGAPAAQAMNIQPATVYFSDDFESGAGKWTLTGTWALTTSSARSATHSLTDSPSGNYAPNTMTWARITQSLNLATAVSPVLRFWHKARVYSGDYIEVQTSTDGTNWSNPRYWSYWYQDGWMLEQIDLPNNSNVAIRFALQSDNDANVEDGWTIDDVWVGDRDQSRLTVPFSDSFEAGPGNWTTSGYDWALTTSTSRSSSHSLTDSPSGNYLPCQFVSATLAHPLDLRTTANPVLRFWHRARLHSSDYADVQVSTNGGTTWSDLRYWYGTNVDGWMLEQLDLPSSDNVVIRFLLGSSNDTFVADGWFIDDVWIGARDQTRLSLPFSDSFETGMGNWITSGFDWALTSSATRSGSHALTDSPSGDYLPFQYVSATLAHPVDLRTTVNPALRFWHKASVYSGDYIDAQISTNGGTTWSDLRYWSSTYQDGWMLEQLDLPSSDNVLVRFLLQGNDDVFVADGWTIDDVWIGPKDQTRLTLPFSDGFEGGLGNWITSGYDWDLTASAARAGTHSLTDSPGGEYLPRQSVSATLAHPLDLRTTANPVLKFWHRLRDFSGDYGIVQVSTDGGTNWNNYRYWSYSFQDGWMPEQIDLPSNDNVLIRFQLQANDDGLVADGWTIDDVWVGPKDAARMPLPFFDDFESGAGNWIVSGHDWGLVSWPSWVLTDSPEGNYAQCQMVSATLVHPFDLRTSVHPQLKFNHRGRIYSGDYGIVQVSTNGGTDWSNYKSWSNWYPSAWMPDSVDLPGTTDNVAIRFVLQSSTDGYVDDGWYIDQLRVLASSTTGVDDEKPAALPLQLQQNFPNPVQDLTTIRYHLPEAADVSVRILDPAGRLIRSLTEGRQSPGDRTVQWDGRDAGGRHVAAGIYFYQLRAGARNLTRNLVVLN